MSLDKFITNEENIYIVDSNDKISVFMYKWLIDHNFNLNKYICGHIYRQLVKHLKFINDNRDIQPIINIHMINLLPCIFDYFSNIENEVSKENIPESIYKDYIYFNSYYKEKNTYNNIIYQKTNQTIIDANQ